MNQGKDSRERYPVAINHGNQSLLLPVVSNIILCVDNQYDDSRQKVYPPSVIHLLLNQTEADPSRPFDFAQGRPLRMTNFCPASSSGLILRKNLPTEREVVSMNRKCILFIFGMTLIVTATSSRGDDAEPCRNLCEKTHQECLQRITSPNELDIIDAKGVCEENYHTCQHACEGDEGYTAPPVIKDDGSGN